MSALSRKKEASSRGYPVRTAIRDGAIVQIKRCHGCEQDKIISKIPRESEFSVNTRWPDKRIRSWKTLCKKCWAKKMKAHRAANLEANRRSSRETYKRRCEDLEWVAFRRDYLRTYVARRRKEDPEFAERRLETNRRWLARKREQDPGYFSRARRDERKGPEEPWVDRAQPRIPAGLFREWLRLYAHAMAIDDTPHIVGQSLGLVPQTLARIYKERQERIAFDVVCRALTRARCVVYLDGKMIVTIEDLYGEYLEANPGVLG